MTQTVIERVAHPSVSLAVELETVTLAEHGETLIGVVRGSVIHHDQLEIGIALRVDAGDRLVQILRDIETGANDGNERTHFFLPSPVSGTRHKPISWLSAGETVPCSSATSAAPSSAGILRRTAPTIETGRSPDPAPEGQKIGSGGEMRAQRTHETQAERDDHPEEKEGQNQGRARSIPRKAARPGRHPKPWHGFSPARQRDARTLARKTKPPERQAFQGLCSYVMAER